MSFLFTHFSSPLRSLWRAAQPFGMSATPPSFKSSVELWMVHCVPSQRALTKILASIGSSIDPRDIHCRSLAELFDAGHNATGPAVLSPPHVHALPSAVKYTTASLFHEVADLSCFHQCLSTTLTTFCSLQVTGRRITRSPDNDPCVSIFPFWSLSSLWLRRWV